MGFRAHFTGTTIYLGGRWLGVTSSIPANNVLKDLSLTVIDEDTGNFTISGSTTLTIPTAGLYIVTGFLTGALTTVPSEFLLQLSTTGQTNPQLAVPATRVFAASNSAFEMWVPAVLRFDAGGTIKMRCSQTSPDIITSVVNGLTVSRIAT